jgi:hypothetical protein
LYEIGCQNGPIGPAIDCNGAEPTNIDMLLRNRWALLWQWLLRGAIAKSASPESADAVRIGQVGWQAVDNNFRIHGVSFHHQRRTKGRHLA